MNNLLCAARIPARIARPMTSRRFSSVKGGMNLSTSSLTTYMPPQIDAAAIP
jgi:hypothetical protein